MAARRELTDEEYDQIEGYFIRRAQHRNRAIFAIQRYAGYRISEVLSLKVKDLFNPDFSMVSKVWVATANMKKKGNRIAIPVHDRMKEASRAQLAELRAREGFTRRWHLFPSRKGHDQPITGVQAGRILKKAATELGIYDRIGTHSMRKTFAMRVYKRTGNDIRATQKALGQKNIETTLHYIEPDTKMIEEAILGQ